MIEKLSINQRGATGIIVVLTLSLVFTGVGVSAARKASSEIRNSSANDLSARASAAADAGIEEAFRRLEENPTEDDLEVLFPESESGSRGDYSILVDEEGEEVPIDVRPDNGPPSGGLEYWEQRSVYQASFNTEGIQQKDEVIQADLSDLAQLNAAGRICDVNPSIDNEDCSGNQIHGNLEGINYCVVNRADDGLEPVFEWTVTHYSATNPADIVVEKYLEDYAADGVDAPGSPINSASRGNQICYEYTIPNSHRSNRRYIFRIKPIYEQSSANSPSLNVQQTYRVDYRVELNTDGISGGQVVVLDNSVVVDVTGVAGGGDIAVRKIAKKDRNGRLLGVFDYVLYSGDPSFPLCKAGVLFDPDQDGTSDLTYNLRTCEVEDTSEIEPGCTDPSATNYSSSAETDDGSCTYPLTNPGLCLPFCIQSNSFSPGFGTADPPHANGVAKPIPTTDRSPTDTVEYQYTGSTTYEYFEPRLRSEGTSEVHVSINGQVIQRLAVLNNTLYQYYPGAPSKITRNSIIQLTHVSGDTVYLDEARLR